MPKISVIMATYNCQDSVKEAIDSILQQTYTDWEFVICDDYSTDYTYDILQQYKEQYPEKFVILQNASNRKLPYSLNHCLQYSQGEYIARMDGDDISLPDRFEKQLQYLEEHPEHAVVGTSMTRFDEKSDYDVYYAVDNPDKYTLLKEVPYCHATIMMRKSAYDALDGYTVAKRTERGQDMDMWFRFYEKGFCGNNIQEPLYKVREDRNALKRRKLKYAIYVTQTRLIGFKRLHYPFTKYYLAFHPIVSHFVPRKWKLRWRERRG